MFIRVKYGDKKEAIFNAFCKVKHLPLLIFKKLISNGLKDGLAIAQYSQKMQL